MKRKIFSFLLVMVMGLVGIFGFTACGDNDSGNDGKTDNGGNTPNVPDNDDKNDDGDDKNDDKGWTEMPESGFDTTKPVTITFHHTMGRMLSDVLQGAIDDFTDIYPNITVNEEAVGTYEDVRDQTLKEIEEGNQPNVVYCYPEHIADFIAKDAVVPLNGFLPDGEYKDKTVTLPDGTKVPLGFTQAEQEVFVQAYYQEGFYYGDSSTMYSLPFSKSTEVLYYNKAVFEQLGLGVPTTWDEMEAVCAALKTAYPNSTPLGYDSESNLFITMCEQLSSPYTSSTGENFLFDNATNRMFVEKFKSWVDNGYLTTQQVLGMYSSNIFTKKNCFMVVSSSAGARNYVPDRVDGEYPFEVGIASVPQINPDRPKVISQGPSVCVLIQNNPQEMLASWLLVKYLTTNVKFQAQFSAVSGYVPVTTAVLQHPGYVELLAEANGTDKLNYLALKACMELAQTGCYFVPPVFEGSATARNQVGSLMAAVFKGDKTIDQAFKDAIDNCKSSIKK
ncbi:MAG: extracellular solute-binding protein [Clostridia bacterium]|nr:extracellular solute-binding protein [Clostridia bacterium]